MSVFERRMGQGLFLALGALGATFLVSALFLEFRGALDFIFRTVFGLLLVFFAAWGIKAH